MDISPTEMIIFLKRVSGFQDLPSEYLEEKIIPNIGISQFEKGQTIIAGGSLPQTIFIIYKGFGFGKPKDPTQNNDKIFLDKCSVLGELDLVSNQSYSNTVSAGSNTTCLTINVDIFNKVMLQEWLFKKAFLIQAATQNIYFSTKEKIGQYHKSEQFNFDIKHVYADFQELHGARKKLRSFLAGDISADDHEFGIQAVIAGLLNYTETHLLEPASALQPFEHNSIHQQCANDIHSFKNRLTGLSSEGEKLHMLEQVQQVVVNGLTWDLMSDNAGFGEYFQGKEPANTIDQSRPAVERPEADKLKAADPVTNNQETMAETLIQPDVIESVIAKPETMESNSTEAISVENPDIDSEEAWGWEQSPVEEQATANNGYEQERADPPPQEQSSSKSSWIAMGGVAVLLVTFVAWWLLPVDREHLELPTVSDSQKKVKANPDNAVVADKNMDIPLEEPTDTGETLPLDTPNRAQANSESVQIALPAVTAPQPTSAQHTKTDPPTTSTALPIKQDITPTPASASASASASGAISTAMNLDAEGIPRGPTAEFKKGFFISMGCFSNKSFAVGQIKRVTKLSLPVYMKSVRDNTIHCVFGGPFPSKNAANAGAERSRNEANVRDTVVKKY